MLRETISHYKIIDKLGEGGMEEASQLGDNTRITELSKRIHACEKSIEKGFSELEAASVEYHKKKEIFDKRFDELDRG